MIEARADQRAELGKELLSGDRNLRIAVGNVMAQLIGEVHRVHRHDHRIGAQNRIVRDHGLRAVLHEQQHAITFFYAASPLQEASQRVYIVLECTVGERRAVVDQRGLVGIA